MLFITLLTSALLIYFSCELFVNGIEWFGRKFNISNNAVGTVLAALGTALPESLVTFIAVVFGTTADQKDIGVGAALGGPLILSTVGYAIVGCFLVFYHTKRKQGSELTINGHKLGRDQLWFLCIFILNIILGFTVFPGKKWISILFLLTYVFYGYKEMNSDTIEEEDFLEPLKFRPKQSEPETKWVVLQTIFSLGLIFIGSQLFVSRLELISQSLGIPAHIISLFLSPIATELPETLNAIIWVRQGKEMLALGNISGSMMIQATIPSALGILFTPWLFDSYLAAAALTTVFSITFLYFALHTNTISAKRLSFSALFYIAFVLVAILIRKPG